jgi:hypothetical protein
MGPWRGPLPKHRISPPPILGQFLKKALDASASSPAPASSAAVVQLVETDAVLSVMGDARSAAVIAEPVKARSTRI